MSHYFWNIFESNASSFSVQIPGEISSFPNECNVKILKKAQATFLEELLEFK
jgi:hypothetical protein